MRDFIGRPLSEGDEVVTVWDGSTLKEGVVVKPGPTANKYKVRHQDYIYVETSKGKRSWRYYTQVVKIG